MNKIIQTNITNIGDPMIILYNDKYYMYSTGNDGNGYFEVKVSDDLKHFDVIGSCMNKEDTFGVDRFWAPEVVYYKNKFYMFYSAGAENGIMHIQVATSDKPTGPFKDARKTPLINLPKLSTIDAHCFIDDDGKKYLFFSMDCSTNVVNGYHTSQIYAVRLTDDLLDTIGDIKFISTPKRPWEKLSGDWFWNEGPFVIKHNGRYFLNYSTNFYCSKEYSVGCNISDNVFGPYVNQQDSPILKYVDGEISGPGHNAFFYAKDGSLMTTFHIHTSYENPSADRKACICGAHFDENNLLVIDYK